MELPKSQKKIARELISEALRRECKMFMEEVNKWMNHLTQEKETSHNNYLTLYEKVKNFDKHIAQRYDDLTSRNYLIIIASLLFENVLIQEDINNFSNEVQQEILKLKDFFS